MAAAGPRARAVLPCGGRLALLLGRAGLMARLPLRLALRLLLLLGHLLPPRLLLLLAGLRLLHPLLLALAPHLLALRLLLGQRLPVVWPRSPVRRHSLRLALTPDLFTLQPVLRHARLSLGLPPPGLRRPRVLALRSHRTSLRQTLLSRHRLRPPRILATRRRLAPLRPLRPRSLDLERRTLALC